MAQKPLMSIPRLLLPLLLLLLTFSAAGVLCDEADFSDHITCYECEGQLNNSTCSSPGVDIDKVLNQVSCVKGACLKWTFYQRNRLQIVRTCSLRVNVSLYLQSACRKEKGGNGFLCMCPNDFCNSAQRVGANAASLPWQLALAIASAVAANALPRAAAL